jgi:hypothetical protein
MNLKEWCDGQGPGSITRLAFDTRLAYTTVWRATQGVPVDDTSAELISKATKGKVTKTALREGFARKVRRAAKKASR